MWGTRQAAAKCAVHWASWDWTRGEGGAYWSGSSVDVEDGCKSAGVGIEVFDGIRAGVLADRSQFFKDVSGPFYGANRAGSKNLQGFRDSFWLQGCSVE